MITSQDVSDTIKGALEKLAMEMEADAEHRRARFREIVRCQGACFCTGACERTPEQQAAYERRQREWNDTQMRVNDMLKKRYRPLELPDINALDAEILRKNYERGRVDRMSIAAKVEADA